MAAIISPKIFKFCCECCGTKTNNKKDINNHYLTPKHIKKANPQQNAPSVTQNPQQNQCKICKKEYESRSGLWRHKKTCVAITEKANITLNTSEMNSGYIKDKDSVIDLLINENKDFKNIIMELI